MLDHTRRDIASKYRAPLIKSPATDLFNHIYNLQFRKDCAPYERMYTDCMEAYGYHIGTEKCRLVLEDMYECVYRTKRIRRVFLMNEERLRQIRSGERKEHYPPTPPLDLY